jgi:hypothetical protein
MSKKTFHFDENKLRELYIEKNMRRIDIAEYYGCSDVLVKQQLRKFGIKKDKRSENENKKRRVNKDCLHCGQIFEVTRFRSEGKWQLKFCSHSCSSRHRYLGEEHKRKMRNKVAATRRANIKNASVDLTEDENQRIIEIYQTCPKGYEVDHIVPISKGGKHHPDNLQHLTMPENRRKHNKLCPEI